MSDNHHGDGFSKTKKLLPVEGLAMMWPAAPYKIVYSIEACLVRKSPLFSFNKR